MTRLRLSVLFVLIWSTLLTVPSAADDPAPFRFFKQVDRGDSQEEEILAVTLDSEIYAATRDALPDIRIVSGQGTDAPFITEAVTESRTRRTLETAQCRVVSLRKIEDDGVEIVAALEKKTAAAEGFRILTPLRNYERHVQVFGSHDGAKWTPLLSDAFLFDYSRIIDVHNDEIHLPKNDFRQFKFVIAHITDVQKSPFREITEKFQNGREVEKWEKRSEQRRPFRIDRISYSYHLTKEQQVGNKKADYPVRASQAEADPEHKQTIVTVHTRREPLTGLTVKTMSHNFSRRVVVQVPVTAATEPTATHKKPAHDDDSPKWTDVGRATISDVSFRDFHREQLQITFPEQRQQTYRIIIHNEDNPPLEITAVEAEGNVNRIVFRASQGETYRLFYGSETTQRPSYETEPLREMLQRGFQPVEASLGPQIANPNYSEEKPSPPQRSLLDNKFFLGFAICLMVVVLGWILFRAGGRIGQIPNESNQ